jgi:hypothetical protein
MTRNRKKREIKPFPKFEDAQPFDPAEFNTALDWYENAALKKAQVDNPEKFGAIFDFGNGKVEEIRFTDIPMNRGMIALKERYGDDQDKFFSIVLRIQSLFKIYQDGVVEKYIRRKGEIVEIHPAVVDAAASVKLNDQGWFPVDKFLETVDELIHTKYKDDESIE